MEPLLNCLKREDALLSFLDSGQSQLESRGRLPGEETVDGCIKDPKRETFPYKSRNQMNSSVSFI